MGIALTQIRKKNLKGIKIILKIDDALDHDHEEMDWDEYTETLDENKLAFLANKSPTRFICNFELKEKDARAIKNYLMSGKDMHNKPTFAFGDWSAEVTRRCLTDIDQPEDLGPMDRINLEFDRDKGLNKKTMGILQRIGAVDEIFGQYGRLTSNDERKEAKN